MKCLLVLIGILLLSYASSYSQWTTPRLIDSSATVTQNLPLIAIGPLREIAIVCWEEIGGGRIVSRYSSDNGRTFRKTTVAEGVPPHPSTDNGISVHLRSIGFDSSGSLYVFFESRYYSMVAGVLGTVFLVSKSTNQGITFSSYWSSGSQRYNGMSGPNLNNSSMLIDANRRVHILWDSSGFTPPPSRITHLLTYSKIGQGNPPSRVDGVVHSEPLQPPYFQRLDVDLLTVGNNVIVAVGRQVPSTSSVYGLYFSRSTDGGQTFSPLVSIDTVNATVPHLTKMSDGQSLLLYNKGTTDSNSDTTLLARYVVDSMVSAPFRVGSKPIVSRTTKKLLSKGTHHYLTYQTTYASFGTTYYDFGNLQSPALDSAFFSGHSSPDFALDSLDGKYLVTVFQNRVYLSKKDVLLDKVDDTSTPTEFNLHQNYPNPFNPTTSISFTIGQSSFVELKVFDLLGREVAMLVNEKKWAGYHSVDFDASTLSSGMYFYTLRAGAFRQTKRMILLR